jgi:hypothetical protein
LHGEGRGTDVPYACTDGCTGSARVEPCLRWLGPGSLETKTFRPVGADQQKTTVRRFKPLRAEPDGVLVHHLSQPLGHAVLGKYSAGTHPGHDGLDPSRSPHLPPHPSLSRCNKDGQLAGHMVQPKMSDVGLEPMRSGRQRSDLKFAPPISWANWQTPGPLQRAVSALRACPGGLMEEASPRPSFQSGPGAIWESTPQLFPASRPGSKPASQPASQPAEQPSSQAAARQRTSQPASQDRIGNQQPRKAGSKPTIVCLKQNS